MLNMTAAEAAQMLGRPLTTAEAVWLETTRGVADYQLYCCTVVLLVILYTVACLPYAILDYLRLPFFEQYRLQPAVAHSLADTWKCYKDVIGVMVTTILPLQLLSYPFFKVAGITASLPLPTLSTLALQLFVFLLIEDYGNYWIHRLFHHPLLYKRIHYKHHEYTSPMSAAATYAHWIEVLLLGVPTLVGPAIVQCHVVTLWVWILLRQLEAIETHSGYDFPWSPTRLIPFYGGPRFHDYHHEVGGESHCNFASIFTICDWLYGTDKGYYAKVAAEDKMKKLRAESTGLKNE
ncbi:unnamed protein product [Closterium sp. NIES-53]